MTSGVEFAGAELINFRFFKKGTTNSKSLFHIPPSNFLWGQAIKLAHVASTSEFCENQWNDLLFFEIVPCHFCGASEVQTENRS